MQWKGKGEERRFEGNEKGEEVGVEDGVRHLLLPERIVVADVATNKQIPYHQFLALSGKNEDNGESSQLTGQPSSH